MRMMKLLCGFAALPLLVAGASAHQASDGKTLVKKPAQLSEQQMDKVTAGWDYTLVEVDNTGTTVVLSYQTPNNIVTSLATSTSPAVECGGCYLYITNRALTVGSWIAGGPN